MLSRSTGVAVMLWIATSACGTPPHAARDKKNASGANEVTLKAPGMLRSAIIAARKKYRVKVVSFDASQEYGVDFPYSDMVRVRITNGSAITLPFLTLLTKRYDGTGKMIGSSRAPAIPVRDLLPGETAEVDFYPRGHLPGVKRITVEIESLIGADDERFIEELKGAIAD